ncbi:MAG: heme exporter protein CcmB [Rickettsiales bacterium]|nr:heme exporter protein CcmB [Rickettsiales bacterium]
MFWHLVGHSLTHYIKNKGYLIQIYGAFVIIAALYAHHFSMDPLLQQRIAYAVIWINMMLAFLLSLPMLYQKDAEEGLLEQWIILPQSLEITILAKWVGHWLAVMIPIILFIPLTSLMLHVPEAEIINLCISVLVGSVAMLAVGSVGAAATAGKQMKSEVIILMIMPFYFPILVFGVSAVDMSVSIGWTVLLGVSGFISPLSLYTSAALLRSRV